MLEEESEAESEYAPTKCRRKDNFRDVQKARNWRESEGRRKLLDLLAASLCEKDTMSEHTPMVTDDQEAEERAKSLSDISFPEDLLKYAQEIVENLENEADMIEEIKSAACQIGELKIARQLQEIQQKSFMEDTLEVTEGFLQNVKDFRTCCCCLWCFRGCCKKHGCEGLNGLIARNRIQSTHPKLAAFVITWWRMCLCTTGIMSRIRWRKRRGRC